MATVTVPAALAAASVAVSFTASYFPAFEGRPVMAPVLLLRARPGGRPAALHVSADLAAVSVALGWMSTATPVYACVLAGAVTLTAEAAVMVQVKVLAPRSSSASVGVMMTAGGLPAMPGVVGVPEISPVVLSRARPAGR